MIRRSKRTRNFTTVDNAVISDTRLSWGASGLLIYLLSMPDNWVANRDHLASLGKGGRDNVATLLRELTTTGYLVREKHRDDKGRISYFTTIYDTPKPNPLTDNPLTDNPLTDNPLTDNPLTDNPSLINTNQTIPYETNTDVTKPPTPKPQNEIVLEPVVVGGGDASQEGGTLFPEGFWSADSWEVGDLCQKFKITYPEDWNRELAILKGTITHPENYRRTVILRLLRQKATKQATQAQEGQSRRVVRVSDTKPVTKENSAALLKEQNRMLEIARASPDWEAIRTRAESQMPAVARKATPTGNVYKNSLACYTRESVKQWHDAGQTIPAIWKEGHHGC